MGGFQEASLFVQGNATPGVVRVCFTIVFPNPFLLQYSKDQGKSKSSWMYLSYLAWIIFRWVSLLFISASALLLGSLIFNFGCSRTLSLCVRNKLVLSPLFMDRKIIGVAEV